MFREHPKIFLRIFFSTMHAGLGEHPSHPDFPCSFPAGRASSSENKIYMIWIHIKFRQKNIFGRDFRRNLDKKSYFRQKLCSSTFFWMSALAFSAAAFSSSTAWSRASLSRWYLKEKNKFWTKFYWKSWISTRFSWFWHHFLKKS